MMKCRRVGSVGKCVCVGGECEGYGSSGCGGDEKCGW